MQKQVPERHGSWGEGEEAQVLYQWQHGHSHGDSQAARRPLVGCRRLRLPAVEVRDLERLALGAPLLPPRIPAPAGGEAGSGGFGWVPPALHDVPEARPEPTRTDEPRVGRQRRRRWLGPGGASLDSWLSSALPFALLRRLLRETGWKTRWCVHILAHVSMQARERLISWLFLIWLQWWLAVGTPIIPTWLHFTSHTPYLKNKQQ